MIIDTSKILAIITTYNGEQWIDNCLRSLRDSSIPLRVIVVDNASVDNTVALVKEKYRTAEVIETDENLGFGRANNIGLQRALDAGADFVFLLNQDAWVEANTVETLVQAALAHADFGIFSPFHLNWEGNKADHFFLRMVGPDACKDFLSDSFLNQQKDIYPLDFIHAACWLISKKCLQEVGGFDPLFTHYGEDNDYVARAALKGLATGIVPAAKVYHAGFFDISKNNEDNMQLRSIQALLDLKRINGSLKANYFLFLKERLDRFSTLFLTKHFKKSFRELKLALVPFRYYKRIRQSRRLSGQPKAFLS